MRIDTALGLSAAPEVISVVGAVVIRGGRCLATQRSATMSLPFLWEFPGGKVEDGEDPPAALRRELKEELAVDALIGDLVGRVTIALLADTESSICLRLFRACFEGEVRLSEHSSLGWFTVDELKCLAMPAADRVLLPSVCGWMSPPV